MNRIVKNLKTNKKKLRPLAITIGLGISFLNLTSCSVAPSQPAPLPNYISQSSEIQAAEMKAKRTELVKTASFTTMTKKASKR